jgi:hypothetical protein
MRNVLASTAAAVLFVVGSSGHVLADAILLADTRYTLVHASIQGAGLQDTAGASATSATFQSSSSAEVQHGAALASTVAGQYSFVSGTRMTGFLSASGWVEFAYDEPDAGEPVYDALSLFDVTFRLDAPHQYALSAEYDWGWASYGEVHLLGDGLDPTLQYGRNWSIGGILDPGTYRLHSIATDYQVPFGRDARGNAQFDLTLSSVPEPGTLLLFAVGALGLCAGRWKLVGAPQVRPNGGDDTGAP